MCNSLRKKAKMKRKNASKRRRYTGSFTGEMNVPLCPEMVTERGLEELPPFAVLLEARSPLRR